MPADMKLFFHISVLAHNVQDFFFLLYNVFFYGVYLIIRKDANYEEFFITAIHNSYYKFKRHFEKMKIRQPEKMVFIPRNGVVYKVEKFINLKMV